MNILTILLAILALFEIFRSKETSEPGEDPTFDEVLSAYLIVICLGLIAIFNCIDIIL
jgi:hypothetical protein